jgi:glycosyltransferase involved in cell wall biosynthesis
VIAFRRGSAPEVVDHGVSGYIVDSVDGAARAVGRLGALDRKRVRATFERRFTVERMAQDYVDIYRTRAAAHRHRSLERPQLTAVSLRA